MMNAAMTVTETPNWIPERIHEAVDDIRLSSLTTIGYTADPRNDCKDIASSASLGVIVGLPSIAFDALWP